MLRLVGAGTHPWVALAALRPRRPLACADRRVDGDTTGLGLSDDDLDRGVVLPCQSISGLSGEGASRHGFLTLVRPERLRRSYELEGVRLARYARCRMPTYDGLRRGSPRVRPCCAVDDPKEVENEQAQIFVSMSSSAAAAEPELAASWMAIAESHRLSLVMDTPATVALHRWCGPKGARFEPPRR